MSCEELAGVVSAGALVVGALVAGGETKIVLKNGPNLNFRNS